MMLDSVKIQIVETVSEILHRSVQQSKVLLRYKMPNSGLKLMRYKPLDRSSFVGGFYNLDHFLCKDTM